MRIITLLTDFGLRDPYVAEMKAVILSIFPEVRIVDISHEIQKFNVRMGAFVLASATPYFPPGTIHVAVVDPGVGTSRRPIIVEGERHVYVGPDNGVLMLAAEGDGIRHVYHITNPRYMLSRVSRTFHGRDIFAPAAAYLAMGVPPYMFGPEIQDYVTPRFARVHRSNGTLHGEVLHIDGFGNVVSNISAEDLRGLGVCEGDALQVRLGGKSFTVRLCGAYGEVPRGELLAIIGSHDRLEISVNQGSASERLGVREGDPIQVSPVGRVNPNVGDASF